MNNSSSDDHLSLGKLVDTLKLCDNFNDLSDDFDQGSGPYKLPHQPDTINPSTETEKDNMRYEEYLRAKWGCSEAMPASFDPEKLEKIRKARFGASGNQGGSKPAVGIPLNSDEAYIRHEMTALEVQSLIDDTYQDYENISADAFVTDPLSDGEEELDDYESEGTVKDGSDANKTSVEPPVNSISQATNPTSKPTKQKRIPRIKTGSMPPLSRSAFARGGEPCVDGTGKGENGTSPIVYPRVPKYFPYQSRSRKK